MNKAHELLRNLFNALENYNKAEGDIQLVVREDSPQHVKDWEKAYLEAQNYLNETEA